MLPAPFVAARLSAAVEADQIGPRARKTVAASTLTAFGPNPLCPWGLERAAGNRDSGKPLPDASGGKHRQQSFHKSLFSFYERSGPDMVSHAAGHFSCFGSHHEPPQAPRTSEGGRKRRQQQKANSFLMRERPTPKGRETTSCKKVCAATFTSESGSATLSPT